MQLKYSDLLIHNFPFSWCLIRNEGLLGFYKGVVPNLIRVTPACCITFVVYENVSRFLLDQHKWTENMNECSGAVLQGAELGLGWAVPSATVFDTSGGVISVNREKSNILVLSGKLKCMMLQSSKCLTVSLVKKPILVWFRLNIGDMKLKMDMGDILCDIF